MRVVVVGSVNRDYSSYVERLPLPGETVLAYEWRETLGGKGANQAVAAARVGARVSLVARVGDDPAGSGALRELGSLGVGVDHVLAVAGTTGAAQITVGRDGRNTIVVMPGANAEMLPAAVVAAEPLLREAAVVLTQGELSAATIAQVAASARGAGGRFLLNLAPAVAVDPTVREAADPLVVNETEAVALLGRDDLLDGDSNLAVPGALRVAAELAGAVARSAVVTLGSAGAVASDGARQWHQPAPAAREIRDTTGAGDAFTGVLAAILAEGASLADAVRAGVHAGTFAVAREGTTGSYPSRAELHSAMSRR
jgi:ribokinase